jgi:hypothetical protein
VTICAICGQILVPVSARFSSSPELFGGLQMRL